MSELPLLEAVDVLLLVVLVGGGSVTVSGPALDIPPPPSEATNVTGTYTPEIYKTRRGAFYVSFKVKGLIITAH